MSKDPNEVEKLKLALAEKEAVIAKMKTAAEQGKHNQEGKDVAKAKRALLKAQTKKEGDFALYFIPENGEVFYRLGVTFQPGTVVRLPLAEDPSVNWLPVEDVAPAAIVAPAASKGRASDRDLA